MSGRFVAKRYARALLEAAEDTDDAVTVETDMAAIDKILCEAPSIRQFCLKPHSNRMTELEFVKIAFIPFVEEYTARTITTAVENGRLAAIPFIPSAVQLLLEEKWNSVEVLLESARKLESGVKEQVMEKMTKKTGKKINLQTKIVPEILGGIRIIWQNKIIDMSAMGRLERVRQLLK